MHTNRPNRQSTRLRGYDYSQNGAYFITICSYRRECLFGEIIAGQMRLNEAGQVVADCWQQIPQHHPHDTIDQFIVMPNHLHGILLFDDRTEQERAPTKRAPTKRAATKRAATKRAAYMPPLRDETTNVGARYIAPGYIAPGYIAPGLSCPRSVILEP